MVTIRRLGPDDVPVLRAVRLAALTESPAAFGRTLVEEADAGDDRWRGWIGNGAMFVAETATGVAGMAGGFVSDDEPSLVYLVAMWVDPAQRRHGAGRSLVEAVLAWAAGEGAAAVRLTVVEGNDAAIRLYERCGFEPTGESFVRERDGRRELYYQRLCGGSDAEGAQQPRHERLRETARSTVRRRRDRGVHDRDVVDAVLDEALVCHVGVVVDGRPVVIPTAHARVGDRLYLHGGVGNHLLRTLAQGSDGCVTVTLVDGLVLARSAFHHSINYRSVVLFGRGEAVTDDDEKRVALDAIVEHLVPGRTADARGPTAEELRSTLVVRFPIDEGSAKVRTGPPVDDDADMALPVWGGVIPLSLQAGVPVPDGATAEAMPHYASAYSRTRASSASSGNTFDTLPSR